MVRESRNNEAEESSESGRVDGMKRERGKRRERTRNEERKGSNGLGEEEEDRGKKGVRV